MGVLDGEGYVFSPEQLVYFFMLECDVIEVDLARPESQLHIFNPS